MTTYTSCGESAVVLVQGHSLCDRHCDELAEHAQRLKLSPVQVVHTWLQGSATEGQRSSVS